MNLKLSIPTLLITAAWVLSSCSVIPVSNTHPTGDEVPTEKSKADISNRNIAKNLLFTLVQVKGLNPYETTVDISNENQEDFAREVQNALYEAGYAVRYTDDGATDKVVSSTVSNFAPGPTDVFTYSLSIGGVKASRLYSIEDDEATPRGSIRISGTPYQPIVTNDQVFGSEDSLDVRFETTAQSTAVDPEKNVFDSMASNYESVFTDYDIYAQTTIHFGNDSLRLEELGKLQLEDIIKDLDPERDIISVIGCSLGSTDIVDGNEILAKGRAGRVREELLYSGVSDDVIMEEACWAPTKIEEVLPSRAVLVSVRRAVI